MMHIVISSYKKNCLALPGSGCGSEALRALQWHRQELLCSSVDEGMRAACSHISAPLQEPLCI